VSEGREGRPFGVIGIFAAPEALIAAAQQFRAQGFRALEAYTPYAVDGLDEAVRPARRAWLPAVIFAGGVGGALIGYLVQYWAEAVSYPLNVGGRPYNSWPAFIVSTFEMTVLCALAAGFFAFLLGCRLPRLYHPIFAAPGFERASEDRFVLCIGASDPSFEPGHVRRILERHGAERVEEVPAEGYAGVPAEVPG
jgi:hypothetical protein